MGRLRASARDVVSARAEALPGRFEVARVAADPPPAAGADSPAGWTGLAYYRLHGSPRMYWLKYDGSYIDALAARIRANPRSADVWCVFDNTPVVLRSRMPKSFNRP